MIFSIVIVVVSVSFAVIILKDERNIVISEQPLVISIHPLLLYFITALLVTCISIVVKVRLYASSESSNNFSKPPEETLKNFRWNLVFIYILAIIVIAIIPLLALLIPGIFWLTGLTGFVTGINLSEIIIYAFIKKFS